MDKETRALILEMEEKVKIDKDSLDLEVVSQPELFYKIASAHAMAISRRDEAYEEMKQAKADCELEIRNDHIENGEKFTEGLIAAEVLDHENYRQHYKHYAETKEVAERLSAIKETILQRSYMIKELVQLYVTGYHSDEAMGEANDEVRYKKAGSNKKKVKESRRRRLQKGD